MGGPFRVFYVAGGILWGSIVFRLLTKTIISGVVSPMFKPFDPLRFE